MTIAEVSKMFNISADTLRYYERIGLLPRVTRHKNGIRDYQEVDINWVEFIKCMRDSGISIESLIEYVSLFQVGSKTSNARKNLLIEERDKLQERIQEMSATLKRLNTKIESYEQCLVESEDKLFKQRGESNEF